MAVSYANREIISRGTYTLYYVEITMDSSYLTDGEAIAAADFGFTVIRGIWPSTAPDGYTVEPVRTDDDSWLMKVYSFSNSTNSVVGNIVSGKDLSGLMIPCLILGR